MAKPNISRIYSFIKSLIERLTGLQLFQSRKWLTFLFFVFISAVFWLVINLGELYEAEVTYPVRYVNFPDNKVLIGKVPDKLRLRVRANGFSILKSKLNLNLIPLKFNVSSYSLNSIGNDTFYIVTESVKDILSAELDQITIQDIVPDTLFFRFTNLAVKKVVVIPVLSMDERFFQKQYMQNGQFIVNPDSIIISGPEVVISSIESVETKPIELSNIDDTTVVSAQILANDMVNYSQQKVNITIPVDRFTEVEKNMEIVPLNVPDSLNMIPVPGQASITYRVCISNYNKVLENQIIPHIDYNQVTDEITRLRIFLIDTPQIISNISIYPRETEFLITRK